MTGPLRSRRGAAALLAAAGLALAGCGTGEAATASGQSPTSAPASVSSSQHGKYDGINLPTPYHRPSFTLTDTSGASYDFMAATKGKPTLLFFGYTNCPDVCPTTFADIAVALRNVPKDVASRVQVVFVTTDPKRDTTTAIRTWLDHFDADLANTFVGLTGDQSTLEQAQLSAGVPVAQDNGQTHSALLLLYGADDKAHVAFDSGNTPQDIAHDLTLVAASS